jgi:hypothetical protein
MPSNPPVVADLADLVSQRCGLLLDSAGLYLPGGASLPIVQGLVKGCKAVCRSLANPIVLQDSDVASLTSFAIDRVLDEAELFALEWTLSQWWRIAKKHQEAVSAMPNVGGWLREQKDAIRNQVSTLKGRCEEPYREPTSEVVVAHNHNHNHHHHGSPGYGYRGYGLDGEYSGF